MCGFAGVLGPVRDRGPLVRAMTAAIRHRGPDGEGFWSDSHCELGHARLSVIDLSPAGAQPMTNEDGTIVVAYNGEIYNFQELRSSLEARGHRFRSRTDTEVIVHLYEEVGDRCVDAFNGMFAFALWDARNQRLLLARDRFGQKPLFYARVGDALIFASEIKALLEHPDLPRAVSDEAVDSLLTAQIVPSPSSFYSAVRRLPPATVLVQEVGGVERQRCFWQPSGSRRRDVRFDEACEEVDSLLGKSIERQLVSDVPVGVFLSGGIDSSLLLGKLAERARSDIEAYCLGFDHPAYDELPHARLAATRFGVRLHELVLTADEFARPERVVEMFDEPFADVAALPTEALCRASRGSITVALTGDGGDELFGGYDHHVLAYWLSRTDKIGGARRSVATALAHLVPNRTGFRTRLRTLRRGLAAVAHDRWSCAHVALRTVLSPDDRRHLYTPDFAASVAANDPYATMLPRGRDHGVEQVFEVAGDRVLADLFLHKTDISSMSVGLECRSPFLDVPLAEFVATLPLEHFVHGLQGKWVLRALLQRRAGPRLARRRKQGFSPPLDEWLRRRLGEDVRDLVLRPGAAIERYVDRVAVDRMYREHVERRADHRRLLWTLLLLECFLVRAKRRVSRSTSAAPEIGHAVGT